MLRFRYGKSWKRGDSTSNYTTVYACPSLKTTVHLRPSFPTLPTLPNQVAYTQEPYLSGLILDLLDRTSIVKITKIRLFVTSPQLLEFLGFLELSCKLLLHHNLVFI